MKVALVVNMNNNFFTFARYLRDRGVDAHLFYGQELSAHFKPEAGTYMDITALSYIHELPIRISPRGWLSCRAKKIFKSAFKDFDLIVWCGAAGAFLERAGVEGDIFYIYGSDLYELPFNKFDIKKPISSLIKASLAKYQARSIKKTKLVIANPAHAIYKNAADKLNVCLTNMGIFTIYLENNEQYDSRWNFLSKHDFILFSHTRHVWWSNPDNLVDYETNLGSKRNDRSIKAFAKFIAKTKFKSPILILFEYGPDVDKSKELIHDLGIEKYVVWMPSGERKFILQGLARASIAVDQFREGVAGAGGVTLEAVATGTPIITFTNRQTEDPNNIYHTSPIIEALTEEDIFNILLDYEKRPGFYKNRGIDGRKWFDQYFGSGLADKCIEIFKQILDAKKQNELTKK